MASDRLRLGPAPLDTKADAVTNGGDDRKTTVDGGDDGTRAPRLPRWTRQEILVLIQGKRVAENRVRRGRTVGMAFGAGQVEPKWASVSSYCKRHRVNRGPVQCRKRWSNLAGDYKKIKEWESQMREESESFWAMRNDLRRERHLPGFFDREVYDVLDTGTAPSVTPTGLALTLVSSTAAEDGRDCEAKVVAEAVFDSGRSAAAGDGLLSDFEQSAHEEAGSGSPEKDSPPAKELRTTVPDPVPISGGIHGKRQASSPEMGACQEGQKRRRLAADRDEGTNSLQSQLIQVLERNGGMVNAHLESQNANFQLDREQRKDHANSLVAVLSKLADALGSIADKL